MWWLTLIQGAASLAATNKAADATGDAARDASQTQLNMFNQNRADLTPYREVGYQALNAYAQALGLPGYSGGAPSPNGHALYGDGNTPLTREGLEQAYRDVLGRDADPGGIQHYLTRGPRVGEVKGSFGPLGDIAKSIAGDPLGYLGKKGERRAVTFNEFLNATLGSDEYRQKTQSGQLQEWNEDRRKAIFSPQQEAQPNQAPGGRYAGFEASPGYQFRMDEGMKSIDRNAASRGLYGSGARAKALTRYSQGVASEEFGNYMNRLAGAAGIGQSATNTTAHLGANAANQIAYGQRAEGDARASGYLGAANTINNGINNYLTYRAYK